jgi:uncharacterized protein Usg
MFDATDWTEPAADAACSSESDGALLRQVRGYRLATAEILYHMPDHPTLLQSFTWQHYDIAPKYPELRKFLDFWEDNIDAAIHSVRVARQDLVTPGNSRHADAWMTLQ